MRHPKYEHPFNGDEIAWRKAMNKQAEDQAKEIAADEGTGQGWDKPLPMQALYRKFSGDKDKAREYYSGQAGLPVVLGADNVPDCEEYRNR